MNYFIEGLQGSGKSTLARKLAEKLPERHLFKEGDYSPVELAWCARMNTDTYEGILRKYPSLREEIKNKTVSEGPYRITRYTQIHTDIPGFYHDLEQYEIYNARIPWEDFQETVLRRFKAWNGSDQIFECSLYQNIMEELILFRVMEDEEIMAFYREIQKTLAGKTYCILYLKAENIEENLRIIRKERTDAAGKEQWFPLMMDYFDRSPYAKAMKRYGEKDLIAHFYHRQELELRICTEVFPKQAVILQSKAVDFDRIMT